MAEPDQVVVNVPVPDEAREIDKAIIVNCAIDHVIVLFCTVTLVLCEAKMTKLVGAAVILPHAASGMYAAAVLMKACRGVMPPPTFQNVLKISIMINAVSWCAAFAVSLLPEVSFGSVELYKLEAAEMSLPLAYLAIYQMYCITLPVCRETTDDLILEAFTDFPPLRWSTTIEWACKIVKAQTVKARIVWRMVKNFNTKTMQLLAEGIVGLVPTITVLLTIDINKSMAISFDSPSGEDPVNLLLPFVMTCLVILFVGTSFIVVSIQYCLICMPPYGLISDASLFKIFFIKQCLDLALLVLGVATAAYEVDSIKVMMIMEVALILKSLFFNPYYYLVH